LSTSAADCRSRGASSTSAPSDRRAWVPALAIEWLLVMAVFFVEGGAPAPHVNETHYLAKAKHYWNPDFCPGDAFLDSADPFWVFYATVGALTRWFSLPAVAWIGRAAAWSALAAGWVAVARAAGLPRGAGALAAALLVALVDRGNFAGEWIVGGVEAKCFAYALVLAELAALVRGHWNLAWLAGGAASAWHAVVGGWSVAAVAIVWLTESRATRPSVRAMAPALVGGGLLASLGLAPALLLDRQASPEQRAEAARIYVYERLPHHLAPLSLDNAELARRVVRFALLLAAWAALWRQQRRSVARAPEQAPLSASSDRLFRFAAVAVALAGIGLLIDAANPERPAAAARWLRFYWFRLADVAAPLAVAVAIAGWTARWLAVPSRGWQWAACLPVVACGWHLMARAAERWHAPCPPADRKIERPAEWREACEWVRKHAPADAVGLIDREGQSFKWHAERGDVANWKDLPQDAAAVVAWFDRCQRIWTQRQPDGTTLRTSLAFLGARRVAETAQRYGATLVVTRASPPLALPVAFANDAYAVYRVPRGEEPPP